jgi:hypothetical protein
MRLPSLGQRLREHLAGVLLSSHLSAKKNTVKGVFRYFKFPKILQDSPSHRIFERMHGALNIGKK